MSGNGSVDGKFVNCEPSPWNEPEKLGADAVLWNITSPVSNEPDIICKSAWPILIWLLGLSAAKLPDPIIIFFVPDVSDAPAVCPIAILSVAVLLEPAISNNFKAEVPIAILFPEVSESVSYTHLTLPTIYSV